VDNDKLTEMVAMLETERDAFVQEANARIAFLNGKIAMLQELMMERGDDDKQEN
jgi:hypothetical protein